MPSIATPSAEQLSEQLTKLSEYDPDAFTQDVFGDTIKELTIARAVASATEQEEILRALAAKEAGASEQELAELGLEPTWCLPLMATDLYEEWLFAFFYGKISQQKGFGVIDVMPYDQEGTRTMQVAPSVDRVINATSERGRQRLHVILTDILGALETLHQP
tara:strand:- start:2364 stop:2849 length:486 start_codon:yes stop_codon:yes gene_type:complete